MRGCEFDVGALIIGVIGYGLSVALVVLALGCVIDAGNAHRSVGGKSEDGYTARENLTAFLGCLVVAFLVAVVTRFFLSLG